MSAVLPHVSTSSAAAQAALAARPLQPFDVLDQCHQQVVSMLQRMDDLVAHLQSTGHDARAQQMAREIFDFFMGPAREHHLDEEKHVFPAIIRSGDEELVRHMLRLQQDHGWIEQDWLELAPHFESIAAGYNWFNVDLMAQAIPVFQALYRDHIALEESLIYPEAKARIARWDLQGMGREMAQRRRSENPKN